MIMEITVITTSGSRYILQGDRITRLSEHRMVGGGGTYIDDMLVNEPVELTAPIHIGQPLHAIVKDSPLTTTAVAEIVVH